MMIAEAGVGVEHFGAVDETTKRLVGRCVKVKWLREDEEAEPAANGNVAKNNLLRVEQPGAMASSLSVVEVAAQTERPGVQTRSRKEAEMGTATVASEGVGVGRSPFEVEGEA